MNLGRSSVLAEALADRLRLVRVGVVVRDIAGIDPVEVVEEVARISGKELYAAIVGLDEPRSVRGVTVANNIESAVMWRNSPDKAGSIVVFVQGEVPKLHSLGDFDVFSSRDLSRFLITKAMEEIPENLPRRNFWEAIRDSCQFFPLEFLEGFVAAVDEEAENPDAISSNLWRLGLLRDDDILAKGRDPKERLERNRQLIFEMGQLSEQSRRRIGLVLSRSTGANRERLQRAFRLVKEFFSRGDTDVLRNLDVTTVEELLKAGRPLPALSKDSDDERDDVGDGTAGTRPLRGTALEVAISRCLVSGDESAEKALAQLQTDIEERLGQEDAQAREAVSVDEWFGGQPIHPDYPDNDLIRVIGYLCNRDSWGGVIETSRESLFSAIVNAGPNDIDPYNPEDRDKGAVGHSLFSLVREFDRLVDARGERTFSSCLGSLIAARQQLLNHLGLLMSYPFVLFGGSPEMRSVLDEYLEAYAALLSLFRIHEPLLHGADDAAVRYVANEFMRLDVIFVRTPTEWKAMLTPLHPFHLWRFREILRAVKAEDRPLTEDERTVLSDALPDLPHLLHFLVVSSEVSRGDEVVLPQAGSVRTLPTFENHTNRYLGSDGVECVRELLRQWVVLAPYSARQVRLAVVDAPCLRDVLEECAKFVRSQNRTQVIVDAYFTRGQNVGRDVTNFDSDNKDHELVQMLKANRIVVHVRDEASSIQGVAELMQRRPVHIAVLFDQTQYNVTYAPNVQELLVSPLVISYEYDYSYTFGRGTIAPSSEAHEGLFADYHFLVSRAMRMPAGEHLRLQYNAGADLGPINSLLENGATRWLAVADRFVAAYAPSGAVPVGEQRFGQREVAVWAGDESQFVDRFLDLLKRYNLLPHQETVVGLLRRFAHLAAGGLFALPVSAGGAQRSRELREKGLLGAVLAVAWYREQYPGSLVASLDSKLATVWLKARPDGNRKRADLVGVRVSPDGGLVVEVIEVKTHDDDDVVHIDRDASSAITLSGRAVEQLTATLRIIEPIFGHDDPQPLFTPARREVLRYQLHRECFRDIHDRDWQSEWYQRLRTAFGLRSQATPVCCRGLVIHVSLDEPTGLSGVDDSTEPITYVKLGSREVQDLIAPRPSRRIQRPSNTPVEQQINVVLPPSSESQMVPESVLVDEVAAHRTSASELRVADGSHPLLHQAGVTDRSEATELARLFRRACEAFRIQIEECDPEKAVLGPTVWRFYVVLARGQRIEQLRNSLEDISREMKRSGILLSSIPNSVEIALDVPRLDRETVPLSAGLRVLPPVDSPEQMPLLIGVTPEGFPVIRDLSRVCHMLVGGTTGSGKTFFLHNLLISLLTSHPQPTNLRLLISTSKPEDFVFYEGLPHLELGRVIDDAAEAVDLFRTRIPEIFEERRQILSDARRPDIIRYNATHEEKLPPYVIVVDEFADLADQLAGSRSAKDEFYRHIRRVAQLGRNRGVHLILCTQRPSAELVPTHIRNLMNARVALRVNDSTASRMILDEPGAEQLQLHGDLLVKDDMTMVRAQAFFAEVSFIESIVSSLASASQNSQIG